MAASFEGANEPSLEPPNGRGHEPNQRGETRRDPHGSKQRTDSAARVPYTGKKATVIA
jgi:hypothetical protein